MSRLCLLIDFEDVSIMGWDCISVKLQTFHPIFQSIVSGVKVKLQLNVIIVMFMYRLLMVVLKLNVNGGAWVSGFELSGGGGVPRKTKMGL